MPSGSPSESLTSDSTAPLPAISGEEPVVIAADSEPRRGPGGRIWSRVALAVALLAASAGARMWQARRVDAALRDGRKAPFTIKDLSTHMGPWVGENQKMDSAVARATGATESLFRSYQHDVTGQRISVIVLFGPSTEMYVHSPENCYPAAGYELVTGPSGRQVKSGAASWPFHRLVYLKGDGGQADRQEVYYTWRYSGAWTPALVDQKNFERIPGMIKVHIARQIRENEMELLDVDNPCESFLAALMPELERLMASKKQAQAPAPSN